MFLCVQREKKRKGLDTAVDDLKTKAFEFFERVKCAFEDSPYYSYNYKWQMANPLLFKINGSCCIQAMSERLVLICTSTVFANVRTDELDLVSSGFERRQPLGKRLVRHAFCTWWSAYRERRRCDLSCA